MASKQNEFLGIFKETFSARVDGDHSDWTGGQIKSNVAGLDPILRVRRNGEAKKGESFELADLKTTYRKKLVIIEYDVKKLPLSNLLKYWPYIIGDLDKSPNQDIIICQFSDWYSYASYRDLWEWTLKKMKVDPERKVNIVGMQFDHGGDDKKVCSLAINSSIDWIKDQC